MFRNPTYATAGVVIIAVAAAIGTTVAFYAYLVPMTGVTGTQ